MNWILLDGKSELRLSQIELFNLLNKAAQNQYIEPTFIGNEELHTIVEFIEHNTKYIIKSFSGQ